MSMTTTDKLLAVAYGYEQEIPKFRSAFGLCFSCEAKHEIHRHASTWEHNTGERKFPVPSPDGELHALAYYYTADLYFGAYGDLRRDLARHVAHEMLKAEGRW